jgi:hypothetical protein
MLAPITRRKTPIRSQLLVVGIPDKVLMQEQVHRLCCKQLPIEGWRNWVELPHVICPGEFDFKPTASTIVANAANLNILHWLTFDVQRFDTVDTIAYPFPAASAPVEIRIEMAGHSFRLDRSDELASTQLCLTSSLLLAPLREDHPVLQRTFSPAGALRLQLPASSRDRAIRGILDRNSVESPSYLRIPAAIGRF